MITIEQKWAVEKRLAPLERWDKNCHMASLDIVRAGIFDNARVARGVAGGVGGQHSWVVLGDPYDPDWIVDPTLWSYDPMVHGVVYADREAIEREPRWSPKGMGAIWAYGCPPSGGGEEIWPDGLSEEANRFLGTCRDVAGGPLDRSFWAGLFIGPMQGWPAGEILAVADAHPALSALVPIDVLGMLTDRNPGGLYLN